MNVRGTSVELARPLGGLREPELAGQATSLPASGLAFCKLGLIRTTQESIFLKK